MLKARDLPILHGLQSFHAAVAHMQFLQGLMRKLHRHFARARFVARLHKVFHKLRLVEFRHDDDVLPLFQMDPRAGDEFGIFFKRCHFHSISSFFLQGTQILISDSIVPQNEEKDTRRLNFL